MVAEIIGSHPIFITPGHAREYFYTPGITLFRLLTDPADGRCVERTITAYRPDTDMRRQVNAADVYSFTTLLGQVTRSRTLDYSQYLWTIHPEDLEDRQDLANRLLYAALAARPEHRHRPGRDTWLTLDHTGPVSGERRPGPPEHPDQVDDLLGLGDDGPGEERDE